jgi:hypothetical protein
MRKTDLTLDPYQDFSSRDGAYALVDQIQKFWETKRLDYGLRIHAETVSQAPGVHTVWTIKSNMVNGYPPAFFMVK